MKNPIKEVSLKSINDGEILRLFDEKLTEVRENIEDKRTPWFTERKIVIEVTVALEDDFRDTAKVSAKVFAKLAPVKVDAVKVDLTNQLYFKGQGFPGLKGVK